MDPEDARRERDRYAAVYAHDAAGYDRLVSREDAAGRLPQVLATIAPGADLVVVEAGAGTGRVTRLLAPRAQALHAFDRSPAMLALAVRSVRDRGWPQVTLALADHRALPVRAGIADVAIEGWSFGHLAEEDGPEAADGAVEELLRVVRRGGIAVVIETLGTGRDSPEPPSAALAGWYARLEGVFGFERRWVRTDYRFETPEEAHALVHGFFGEPLASRVRRDGGLALPECTGIWWRRA